MDLHGHVNEELNALKKLALTKTRLRELEQPPAQSDLQSLLKEKDEEVSQLKERLELEQKEKMEFKSQMIKVVSQKDEEMTKLKERLELEQKEKREFKNQMIKVLSQKLTEKTYLIEELEKRRKEIVEYELQEHELHNVFVEFQNQLEHSNSQNKDIKEANENLMELLNNKDDIIERLNADLVIKEEKELEALNKLAQMEEYVKLIISKAARALERELVKKDGMIKKVMEKKQTKVLELSRMTVELAHKDELINNMKAGLHCIKDKASRLTAELAEKDIVITKLKETLDRKEVDSRCIITELTKKDEAIAKLKKEVERKKKGVQQLNLKIKSKNEQLKKQRALNAEESMRLNEYKMEVLEWELNYNFFKEIAEKEYMILMERKETEILVIKSSVEKLELVSAIRKALHAEEVKELKEELLNHKRFLMHIVSILEDHYPKESSELSYAKHGILVGLSSVMEQLKRTKADSAPLNEKPSFLQKEAHEDQLRNALVAVYQMAEPFQPAQDATSAQKGIEPAELAQDATSAQKEIEAAELAQDATSAQKGIEPAELAQDATSAQKGSEPAELAQDATSAQKEIEPAELAQDATSAQKESEPAELAQDATSALQDLKGKSVALHQEPHSMIDASSAAQDVKEPRYNRRVKIVRKREKVKRAESKMEKKETEPLKQNDDDRETDEQLGRLARKSRFA